MLKFFAIAFTALALVACDSAPPVETSMTDNGVQVNLIAVVDGCNVWSINRGGISRTIYMARCPEGAANVDAMSGGKSPVQSGAIGAQ